jgi:hypothetical protein
MHDETILIFVMPHYRAFRGLRSNQNLNNKQKLCYIKEVKNV